MYTIPDRVTRPLNSKADLTVDWDATLASGETVTAVGVTSATPTAVDVLGSPSIDGTGRYTTARLHSKVIGTVIVTWSITTNRGNEIPMQTQIVVVA
jgi:hypothetical protein